MGLLSADPPQKIAEGAQPRAHGVTSGAAVGFTLCQNALCGLLPISASKDTTPLRRAAAPAGWCSDTGRITGGVLGLIRQLAKGADFYNCRNAPIRQICQKCTLRKNLRREFPRA